MKRLRTLKHRAISPMSSRKPEDRERSLWDFMIEGIDRKSELAREYSAARTLDDLVLCAAERLAIATVQIMRVFRPSRLPGITWLRLLALFAPARYRRQMDQHNALFVQCLIHAADRLSEYLASWESSPAPSIRDMMVVWSAAWYGNLLKYSDAEKDMLREETVRAMGYHERHFPKDDNERLKRIMLSLDRKPTSVEMARYIAKCHLEDPVLTLVEPRWLADNLNRILALS
ncbi:MAG: hypothetical protein ACE5JI_21950 [Acidobacteriota bacterium]